MGGTPAEAGRKRKHIVAPTMVEIVTNELRERIMSADLAPGEHLIEERFAEEYGVSRPPIREALRRLEQFGLVIGAPRRGYTVVAVSPKDLREIESLRHALERFALEEAMPVQDPEQFTAMSSALEQIAAAGEDEAKMLDANSAFHVALVDLARHGRLSATYRDIRVQVELCMAQNLRLRKARYGAGEDVYERHLSLFDAIRSGDLEFALSSLANHGSLTVLDQVIEQEAGVE
ncbi:GntR family transcriptional regulator [Microbacterium sp.]|uniref:GntR family transcriptional regulator n=1 Tax=Microbacterium sp. TaxID=51671 RepID=UPI003A8F25FA